jgi:hypothetical protein
MNKDDERMKVFSSLAVLKPEAAGKIILTSTPSGASDRLIHRMMKAKPFEFTLDKRMNEIAKSRNPASEVPMITGRTFDKVWMDEAASIKAEDFAKLFLTSPDLGGSTISTSVSTEASKSVSYEDLIDLSKSLEKTTGRHYTASSIKDATSAMEAFFAPKNKDEPMTTRTLEDLPWKIQKAVAEDHIAELDAAIGMGENIDVALSGPRKLTVKEGSGYKVKAHIGGEDFRLVGAYIGSRKGPILKFKPLSPSAYAHAEVPIAECMEAFDGNLMRRLSDLIDTNMDLPEPEPATGTPVKLDARRVATYEDFGSF